MRMAHNAGMNILIVLGRAAPSQTLPAGACFWEGCALPTPPWGLVSGRLRPPRPSPLAGCFPGGLRPPKPSPPGLVSGRAAPSQHPPWGLVSGRAAPSQTLPAGGLFPGRAAPSQTLLKGRACRPHRQGDGETRFPHLFTPAAHAAAPHHDKMRKGEARLRLSAQTCRTGRGIGKPGSPMFTSSRPTYARGRVNPFRSIAPQLLFPRQ